ncbi:MAG: prepilin-type N-terminal cleavage/methylation domain-containing protein [Sedimenticolaceae bacterium]|jgi:MSHA pilin protein MshD
MRNQGGASLIEMVVSVVIISITVTSVMMVIFQTTANSANPMIRTQAIAIAEAYMEEIMAQPLLDPSGADTGSTEAGEARASYDDVTDYHGLSNNAGAVDQAGNGIIGLEGYNVAIEVTPSTLNGRPARRIRIDVTYDGDPNFTFPLVAYRLN